MQTKTVRNTTDTDLEVVGVGIVKAGEPVVVPADFNNSNFETLPVITRDEAKKKGIDVEKVEKEAEAAPKE